MWAEKTSARALEFERGGMDEQRKKKAWVKKGSPYLLIKATPGYRRNALGVPNVTT